MIRKILLLVISSTVALAACLSVLYIRNGPPVVAPVPSAAAAGGRPYVVKLHAQWCPVCLSTKGVWSEIEAAYGARVNLVVFDFTTGSTTAASRAEARRLGLDAVFEDTAGWTGTVLVLDGATREVSAAIHGSRSLAEYREPIDAALTRAEGRE
jgi:thiol-disulfide isomerase/thioredoxin